MKIVFKRRPASTFRGTVWRSMIGAEGGFDPCRSQGLNLCRRRRGASTFSPGRGGAGLSRRPRRPRSSRKSYVGADSVCGVARRHGLTPSQLFAWRRLARPQPPRPDERPLFVPVIVSPEPEALPKVGCSRDQGARGKRRRTGAASIELEVSGVVVRVGRDADAGAIAAVIGALKASS